MYKYSGISVVLTRRDAPYSAKIGTRIPIMFKGKCIFCLVDEAPLLHQKQEVRIVQDVGTKLYYIRPV